MKTIIKDISLKSIGISEIHIASEIMQEAAKWLEEINKPLWIAEDLNSTKLLPFARNNELFLVKAGIEPAGTVIILSDDKEYWPDIHTGKALYIHKLIIRRKYAGQKFGGKVIELVKNMAIDMGRKYLRLDCQKSHPELVDYYRKQGFDIHSERKVGKIQVVRFQMEIL